MNKSNKSNNQLIKEFMGNKGFNFSDSEKPWDYIRYDSSYDWMVPVMQEITRVWVNTTNRKLLKEITPTYRALQNRFSSYDMNGVFDHSIEFIKWFNGNKKYYERIL